MRSSPVSRSPRQAAFLLPLPLRHTYIFIGLTPSERSLLESLFALDHGAGEDLVPVRTQEEAHLIVANGDDRAVIEGLRADNPQALVVLVGQPPGQPVGDLPVLRRPLAMDAVVELLSRLDWPQDLQDSQPTDFRRTFSPTTTAPATGARDSALPRDTAPPPALDASSFAPTTASMPMDAHIRAAAGPAAPAVSARATWAESEHASLASPSRPGAPIQAPSAEPANDVNAEVLVVTGALGQRSHTLPRGMRRMGFRVRILEGADAALAAFQERAVPFVFLDQASLGDQLLPLARALTAQRAVRGEPPHVVVVARHGSVFDRLRVRMVGCNWMAVPIDRERLHAFFARRGLHPKAARDR